MVVVTFSYKYIHCRADVIDCLSTIVRNDILNDNNHQVSKACRQQLRQQLTQRHESINLDPKLQQECKDDVQRFCSDIKPGKGAVSLLKLFAKFIIQTEAELNSQLDHRTIIFGVTCA